MNQDDFKKILDEALEPIKQKQDSQSTDLANIISKLESHSATLESHSAALVSIESKLNAYGDMYKINDNNVRKIEKRVETLEENSDINPPSEYVLADVS